jgi:alpha-D-xyloside xylohydrolase
MEVTTDAGETVRVLAYVDGTFRVTVAETLPEGRPTAMVVAEPDGEPAFSATAETATLRTDHSSASVGLSDGRLTVYDAAGKLLLDEYAPARRLTRSPSKASPGSPPASSSTAAPTRASTASASTRTGR